MNFTPAAVIAAALCALIACALFAAAVYLRRSNAPVHLWNGALFNKKQITDTCRYNRANSMIWFVFGLYALLCAAAALILGFVYALIGLGLLAVFGVPVLKLCSRRIFLRYIENQQDSSGK